MNRQIAPTPRLEDLDIIILDAYSLLFRAYHSFPLTLTTPSGQIVNAVYGFTRMLLRVLELVRPEYLVTATDMGEPTFRHEAYDLYKANREEADIELKQQFPLMTEVLQVLGIPMYGINGFEADDIIGTLSERFAQQQPDLQVAIFTSDKDSYQLIHDNIFVLSPDRKNHGDLKIVGQTEAFEKLQVHVDQVVDYKALCGDPSDNIPGVKGIGPKTAATLLLTFGTLENLYASLALIGAVTPTELVQQRLETLSESEKTDFAHWAQELRPHIIQKLDEGQGEAWLSQSLARIDTHVPLDFSLEQARLCDYDKNEALRLFTQLGFESLKNKLPKDEFESQVQASLFG